jgi:hypothetical protein
LNECHPNLMVGAHPVCSPCRCMDNFILQDEASQSTCSNHQISSLWMFLVIFLESLRLMCSSGVRRERGKRCFVRSPPARSIINIAVEYDIQVKVGEESERGSHRKHWGCRRRCFVGIGCFPSSPTISSKLANVGRFGPG